MSDYTPITVEDASVAGALIGTWWRQPPYEIRKGAYAPYRGEGSKPVSVKADVLAPDGKQTLQYEPIDQPQLLGALLDVAQGKLKPVEFAERFGLLGYNYIVPDQYRCSGGDPLNWFLAQANTVLTITDIIRRLKEARDLHTQGRVATYLRKEITDGPYALGGRVANLKYILESFRKSRGGPVLAANGILRYLFNANLGQAERRFQSTAQGLRTVFTFRALVEDVYWQLADQLVDSSIHRCTECGRIFIHPNMKVRFCPPAAGKKISPCKARWNVREFRKKRSRRKKR